MYDKDKFLSTYFNKFGKKSRDLNSIPFDLLDRFIRDNNARLEAAKEIQKELFGELKKRKNQGEGGQNGQI